MVNFDQLVNEIMRMHVLYDIGIVEFKYTDSLLFIQNMLRKANTFTVNKLEQRIYVIFNDTSG